MDFSVEQSSQEISVLGAISLTDNALFEISTDDSDNKIIAASVQS